MFTNFLWITRNNLVSIFLIKKQLELISFFFFFLGIDAVIFMKFNKKLQELKLLKIAN